MKEYLSYPKGYKKLVRDLIPFYMKPMKSTIMRLLLVILSEG